MSNLDWQENTNLEDSLKEYFETEIQNDSLTVFHNGENKNIDVRVGFPESNDWILPVISCFEINTNNPRLFVGTTKVTPGISITVEIRGLNDRNRSDLARWVRDKLMIGFPYYEYSPNPSNPDSPIKNLIGRANVNFLTDAPIRLQNVDEIDLFRHGITISVEIN